MQADIVWTQFDLPDHLKPFLVEGFIISTATTTTITTTARTTTTTTATTTKMLTKPSRARGVQGARQARL